MAKYIFPFNSYDFNIDKLRAIETIDDSEAKSLLLYEINTSDAAAIKKRFICLLNGSKIGTAIASMLYKDYLYKVPINKESPSKCYYEIIYRDNCNYPTSEIYELFYGSMDDSNNQAQELFDTEEKAKKRFMEIKNIKENIKHSYIIKHYFEEGYCVSNTDYEPLCGL